MNKMKIEHLFNKQILDLFNDDKKFDEVIHNSRNYRDLFNEVHNIYMFMCNRNIKYSDDVMKKINMMNVIYVVILKEEEFISRIATSDIVKEKLQQRLANMKTIDDIDSFFRYYKAIRNVTEGCRNFSLFEQYKDSTTKETFTLNGVSVITPSQTISRYNNLSNNGSYHDENFKEIVNGVYDRNFDDNYSGQDIKVRFVNTAYKNEYIKGITVEVPIPINSSQKTSLINLSNSLQKLISKGIKINVEVSVIQKNGYFYYIDKCDSLYPLLEHLVIDDYVDCKYNEEFFIGTSNLENSYTKKRD